MFTQGAGSSRRKSSLFTPSRGTQSTIKGRRSVSLFTPNQLTPYGSRSISRHGTPRSLLQTSQVIEETQHHLVESYGAPLPVVITEMLALVERTAQPSARFDASGWAWIVIGRQILLWRFLPSRQPGKTNPCHELTFSPSDLDAKADLAMVVSRSDDAQVVGCLAVSADGIVRYWSNATIQGAFVEMSMELNDDEAALVVSIEPFGYVLGTTSGSLYTLDVSQQHTVRCRAIRSRTSVLSGFGRRMSTFIFGAAPVDALTGVGHVTGKTPMLCSGEVLSSTGRALYSLASGRLHKWQVGAEDHKLLYDCDVLTLFKERLAEAVWNQEASNMQQLKVWLLDLDVCRDGIVILAAAVSEDVSPDMYYVLGILPSAGTEAPDSFRVFSVTKFVQSYQEDDEEELLGYRLLIPDCDDSLALMYESCKVVFFSVSGPQTQDPDVKEFTGPGESLLGAGKCNRKALFFSNNHGLVTVRPRTDLTDDLSLSLTGRSASVGGSYRPGETSLALTPAETVRDLGMSENNQERLKAAFLHTLARNTGAAQSIISDLFPVRQSSSSLDRLVTSLSEDLIDDFPSSDPRWAESAPAGSTASCGSLILQHQLEEKQRAHQLYVEFLQDTSLWERLAVAPGTANHSQGLILEHAEKVCAARALADAHGQHRDVLDAAILLTVESRGGQSLPIGLTAQDAFYREVSRIDDVIPCLLSHQEACLASDISPNESLVLVNSVNTLIDAMFTGAIKRRAESSPDFDRMTSRPETLTYIPWTASLGPGGVRNLLKKQHDVTFDTLSATNHQETTARSILFQHLVTLTDLILDGYKGQLDSLRRQPGHTDDYEALVKDYDRVKLALLKPFVTEGQFERAAILAERYCHFETLVSVCDDSQDHARLERYMQQFQGFSDFVFKWYMDRGKRGKLLAEPLRDNAALGRFLQTDGNELLSWLHDIDTDRLDQAHRSLKKLAFEEKQYMSKKKTLLSLSKLAALAFHGNASQVLDIQGLDVQQSLLLNQETLPANVFEGTGLDPDNMRVLTALELIELYVGEYNPNANEFDFKKALDLMQFLDENDPSVDAERVGLHIWTQAILRDDWSRLDTDSPQESNSGTVFFKTIDLAFREGADVLDVMPDLDALIAFDELSSVAANTNFEYLVRAGYESLSDMLT